ncbi:MAG: 50S ribosomal protein L29 [Bdellovibrionota bacterium]
MSDIRGLADQELQQQIADKVDALFKLRVRSATERLENTAAAKNLRRDIARLKTVLQQKTRAAKGA